MPAQGSESKQALTIALVMFVLLTVILGIVAYFGYAEQDNLEQKRVKAEDARKFAEKERDRLRFFKAVYKINSGHGETDKQNEDRNDTRTFLALREEFKDDFKT